VERQVTILSIVKSSSTIAWRKMPHRSLLPSTYFHPCFSKQELIGPLHITAPLCQVATYIEQIRFIKQVMGNKIYFINDIYFYFSSNLQYFL
jgi:hypothetical protein